MNDFQLLRAILEKADCDEDIYFDGDESCIEIDGVLSIYFHPSGDIETIAPHVSFDDDDD